jgi:hypothetical protein
VDWILELKAFLVSSRLPEDESEAERIVREALGYYVKDGDLYRHRPNGVALKCISTHQGRELLRDIHAGECGHHASTSTLTAKAYQSGFYWPSALWDAAEMVKRCEACQFHAKQIHQPAQELQTIPLTWPFAVWGLDILGPFPRAQGGYRYLYVTIDKFTKWVEVEPMCTIPARSAASLSVGWSVTLVCPTASSLTTVASSLVGYSGSTVHQPASRSISPQLPIPGAMAKPSVPTPRSQGTQDEELQCQARSLWQKKWLDNLQSILWSIRTTATKPTRETPFFLVFGAEAVLPTDVKFGSPRVLAFNEICQEDLIKDHLL